MAVEEYLIFVCTLSCLCCVSCELPRESLRDGDEPCITEKGLNGTCVGIFRCWSALLTYRLASTSFGVVNDIFSELSDICSHKNNERAVCCTDCRLLDEPTIDYEVEQWGKYKYLYDDSIAATKCFEYYGRLRYSCGSDYKIEKDWHEDKKCHNVGSSATKPSGGRNARRWEFPHMALIGYGDDLESAQWLCGGSVISERFILTAGHCTSTSDLGNITFAALGLLKRTDPKKYWKIYKIKRIIIHPEYKSPSKYHDIALLETETEINFGRDLLPACLNVDGDRYEYEAEASGWGRLGWREKLAVILQVVYLYEYNKTECEEMYKPHRHLTNGYDHETQMCYGDHEEITDTCEGDSGGPLHKNERECQYTLLGVTSFGTECGILGSAGVYTRVSYYVPWIESIVWPEETEAKRIKENLWVLKWLI